MPQRPQRSLAAVGVLALGDYLLWNWSLGANHDVVALVAGMTLIPLLIVLVWLFVVAVAQMIARAVRRPKLGVIRAWDVQTGAATQTAGSAGAGAGARPGGRGGELPHSAPGDPVTGAAAHATGSPSSKLAA